MKLSGCIFRHTTKKDLLYQITVFLVMAGETTRFLFCLDINEPGSFDNLYLEARPAVQCGSAKTRLIGFTYVFIYCHNSNTVVCDATLNGNHLTVFPVFVLIDTHGTETVITPSFKAELTRNFFPMDVDPDIAPKAVPIQSVKSTTILDTIKACSPPRPKAKAFVELRPLSSSSSTTPPPLLQQSPTMTITTTTPTSNKDKLKSFVTPPSSRTATIDAQRGGKDEKYDFTLPFNATTPRETPPKNEAKSVNNNNNGFALRGVFGAKTFAFDKQTMNSSFQFSFDKPRAENRASKRAREPTPPPTSPESIAFEASLTRSRSKMQSQKQLFVSRLLA